MTLVLSARMTVENAQARQALAALKGDTDRLKTGLTGAGGAAEGTAADLDRAAAAARRAGTALRATAESSRIAGGSVGNLAANFNGVAMMAMAGQNPLQLAIQQGTQIGQVFGPMGAGAALRATGAAFAAMLSPVNLLTIGLIAGGSALVQWAMGAGEAGDGARTLADLTKALADATRAYAGAADAAEVPIDELRGKYGDLAEEVQRALDSQKQLAAFAAMTAVSQMFGGDVLGLDGFDAALGRLDRAEQRLAAMRADLAGARADPAADVGLVAEMEAQLRLQTAAVEDQRLAVRDLEGIYGRTAAEVRGLGQAMADLQTADGPAETAEAAERLRDVLTEVYGSQAAANEATGGLVTALNEAVRASADILSTSASTSDMLSGTVGVVTGIAAALSDAADGARGVAGAGMAGTISAALGPAAQLAARLWDAASAAAAAAQADRTLAQMSIEFSPGGQAQLRYGSRTPGGTAEQNALAARNAPRPIRGGNGGGGGGASAERDGVAELVAERAQVEGLVAGNLRLESAMETMGFVTRTVGESLVDAFMGGADAGERLVDTLKRAVLQAALLGEGPLNGLFGGGPGLVGMIFGGLKLAGGGRVTGPGGPTDDRIPALLSDDEFVVNAAATRRHLPLLEAINSGQDVARLAAGGAVGRGAGGAPSATGRDGGAGRPADAAAEIVLHLSPELVATVLSQAEGTAVRVSQAAVGAYDRTVLPGRMRDIRADPRRM